MKFRGLHFQNRAEFLNGIAHEFWWIGGEESPIPPLISEMLWVESNGPGTCTARSGWASGRARPKRPTKPENRAVQSRCFHRKEPGDFFFLFERMRLRGNSEQIKTAWSEEWTTEHTIYVEKSREIQASLFRKNLVFQPSSATKTPRRTSASFNLGAATPSWPTYSITNTFCRTWHIETFTICDSQAQFSWNVYDLEDWMPLQILWNCVGLFWFILTFTVVHW